MRYLTALLTWLSADPVVIDLEIPKASACVTASYASLCTEEEGGVSARDEKKERGGVGSEKTEVEPAPEEPKKKAKKMRKVCVNGKCYYIEE